MTYEIKYENGLIDGKINSVYIKQHVESKYPGYKVTNVEHINSTTYVQFALKEAIKATKR